MESNIEERINVITIGVKDANKPSFTLLQTSCALLDAINQNISGEPLVNGEKKNLCYSSANLPSSYASNSLDRLALLEQLRICGIETVASSWMKNLKIKEPWTEIPFLSSIFNFLSYLTQWMDNSSNNDFSLEVNNETFNEMVKKINSVATLPKTSSLESRRKEATLSIIAAIEGSKSIAPNTSYFPFPKYEHNNKWEFRIGNLNKEFSSTAAFEITDFAFSTRNISENEALLWRSACLDLWEMFFINDKHTLENLFNISEYRVSKNLNKPEKMLLSFSEVGRMIIDADVYYCISGNTQRFIAYTSPLTGFCIIEHDNFPVTINSHLYLSSNANDLYELGERREDFQQFIYSYVNMRKNLFSDNFRNYIDSQITGNKALIQSRGTNIFKLYPKYREHIPLDIVINQ